MTQLTVAIQDHAISLNQVTSDAFRNKLDKADAKFKAVETSFKNIDQIKALTTINAEVSGSLETIKNLKKLSDERLKSFIEKYNVLKDDAKILFAFPDNQKIADFYTYDFQAEKRQYLNEKAMGHLKAFRENIDSLNESIQTTTQVIGDQFSLIDSELMAAKLKAVQFSLLVIAFSVCITLSIALLFTSGIAKNIVKIERNIALLKDGDLTKRSSVNSKDEIGMLSRNLNLFTDTLGSSIRQISIVSRSNLAKKTNLIDTTNEAMSSVTEIEANTASIGRQINELDQRIVQ